jgi:hypothetical protein
MPEDENVCPRLVIERDSAGRVVGSVHFDRAKNPDGPFPPAENPDVGYPPNVDPSQYPVLGNPLTNVAYRMLDGSFQNGHLTFTWSTFDLWKDWCRLQTSYLWQVGGHEFYFCVPQDAAAQAKYDRGKVVLCTTPDFGTLCTDQNGAVIPCACGVDAGVVELCNPTVCQCETQGCDVALYSYVRVNEDLTLEGGRMRGMWTNDSYFPWAFTFERVNP